MNTSLTNAYSFFGHRNVEKTENLEKKIEEIVERLIKEENFNIFFFGGFGDFDELCYKIVSKLKTKYPHIQRIFCVTEERFLKKKPTWMREISFEETCYFDLKYDYWYTRIYYRNCEIIDRSDKIIFYVVNKDGSGAYKAMKYAQKMKKDLINIAIS